MGTNTGGARDFNNDITAKDHPPDNLGDTTNHARQTAFVAIAPNKPATTAGIIQTYGISPAVPPGLACNAASGWITGTPSSLFGLTTYAITGANTGGTVQQQITIAVVERKLCL